MLRLYSVNDEPHYRGRKYTLENDELYWCLVWAEDHSQLLEFYRECRQYDTDAEDTEELTLESLHIEDVTDKATEGPEGDGPHEEWRPSVMRDVGWRFPGESFCDMCGLAAMGLEEHSVCSWCYLCKGCRKWVNENEKDAEYCDECCPFLED